MKRFIRNACLFILVLFLFLIVKKSVTPWYAGDEIFKAKYKEYQHEKGKHDAVVFGSSRLYRQVNTLLLDSLLNKYSRSTYNFATGGTMSPESYYLYEKFLQQTDSGALKLAFLELQPLHPYAQENVRTTKASYWNNLKYLKFSRGYIKDANYPEEKRKILYRNYMKSYFYSFVDFSIMKSLVTHNDQGIGVNGYYSLEDAMVEYGKNNRFERRRLKFEADTSELMERRKFAELNAWDMQEIALNSTHRDKLNQLIEKSSAKGIFLFLVVPPRLLENQYAELLKLVDAMPYMHTIQLFQYPEYRELYAVENSFDTGHLNSKGTELFTRYLAREIERARAMAYLTSPGP